NNYCSGATLTRTLARQLNRRKLYSNRRFQRFSKIAHVLDVHPALLQTNRSLCGFRNSHSGILRTVPPQSTASSRHLSVHSTCLAQSYDVTFQNETIPFGTGSLSICVCHIFESHALAKTTRRFVVISL